MTFVAEPVKESYTRLTSDARNFATRAHHGQVRGIEVEPYINHPIRVARLVRRMEGSEVAIAAAYLHDVVEDCGVTLDRIRWHFGDEVADVVGALTRTNSETEQQYGDYVARVALHSKDAWLVKRSDVVDNLSTLPPAHPLTMRYIKALLTLDTWSARWAS